MGSAAAVAPAEGDTLWAGINGSESGGTVINAAIRADGRCVILAVANQPDLAFSLAGPDSSRIAVIGRVAFGAT
jgi:hypothetical protein